MNEGYLEEKGLYYRTNGFDPARRSIVFVHGLVGSSSAWLPFEEQFGDEFNILTFDQRGHGRSKKPPRMEDYTLDRFADDIVTLADHVGFRKFTLVSHSFATLVAFAFIAQHQDRLDGAVFLSPSFSLKKFGKTKRSGPIIALLAHTMDLAHYSPRPRGQTDYALFPESSDWDIPRTVADMRNTGIRTWLFAMKNSYDADFETLLPSIAMPTLVIHGRRDSMFPIENSLFMSEKIPGAKLVVLENADHIIVLNNVKEVGDALMQFLAETAK